MKASDARAMTVDQLDDEVLKLKKEQFNLRFQRASGQLENTARIRVVRHDIARVKTVLQQRDGGQAASAAAVEPKAKKAKAVKAKSETKAAAKPAKRASRAKKT